MAVKFIRKILTSLNLVSSEKRAVENSFQGKKLRDFTKEEGDELCGHLQHIARYVCGIQHAVDLPALAYISRMLHRYYGNLTLADITDAFEMRAAGELGLIEHYGTFSAEFIGSVLKKYSALRNAALRRYKEKAALKAGEPTNYVSNEQVYNSLVIWVKWQKKIPAIWLWDAAHQHLVTLQKLKTFDGQTYEQKQGAVLRHLRDMFPELASGKE
jgi:hypothetical protein